MSASKNAFHNVITYFFLTFGAVDVNMTTFLVYLNRMLLSHFLQVATMLKLGINYRTVFQR